MSLFIPKRISELAAFDSDLETPEKPRKKKVVKNASIMPKKIDDIKESDDSDDENKLNCAILNDSFVLSPSKDIPETPLQDRVKSNIRNEESIQNPIVADKKRGEECENEEEELISRVRKIKVPSPEATKSQNTTSSNDSRPILKTRTQLFPHSHQNQKGLKENLHGKIEETVKIPLAENRVPLSAIKNVKNRDDAEETPFKKVEQQHFLTPSTHMYASTNFNAILSTTERDPVKQPKILFRTPSTLPFSSSSVVTPLSSYKKLSPVKERPKENIIMINNVEYEIDKKIGSGGSSSVFLARGCKSGKECAIKLVNLNGDAQVIEGYLNETRLLAKLQGNINVVALYDYCHLPEKKLLYMVMEKGESDLHKTLQKFTTHIPLYTLMNYWYQMLQAVNYIHQNGVIHSDLKPANFLMINGRLKLIDFGIASNIALDCTSIIKFSQAGTFNYISPEALIDTSNDDSPSAHQPRIRLSTKSDVWSLGCILYLLIYKKTPFSHIKNLHQKVHALTNPHTSIDYPKLPDFYPEMLLKMLKMCLIYNPKERSSVADLLKYPFHMIIPINQ